MGRKVPWPKFEKSISQILQSRHSYFHHYKLGMYVVKLDEAIMMVGKITKKQLYVVIDFGKIDR